MTSPTPGVTLQLLRDAGLSLKQASAVIAKLTGASRREIYQRAVRENTIGDGQLPDDD